MANKQLNMSRLLAEAADEAAKLKTEDLDWSAQFLAPLPLDPGVFLTFTPLPSLVLRLCEKGTTR